MDYLSKQVLETADELVKCCEENSTNEMQRDLASWHEAFAKLRELTEDAERGRKDLEKLQKECWEAIKRRSEDEVSLLMQQWGASARALAVTWASVSAIANRAERECNG